MARLSSTVIRSTKVWHLVNKDSRFQFCMSFPEIFYHNLNVGWEMKIFIFVFKDPKMKLLVGLIPIYSSINIGLTTISLIQFVFGSTSRNTRWDWFHHYLLSRKKFGKWLWRKPIFLVNEKYTGHQFSCLENLKYWNIPMLYYNDHIPDFELCKLKEDG
jgi:hypothetical protein